MMRRHFLASSAIAAVPLEAFAQNVAPRNLLSSLWSAAQLSAAVRDPYRPFPTANDRPGWGALSADARAALITAGERELEKPWNILPASVSLDFVRNGNRSRYEALSFSRRYKLADLVLAECVEGNGRFLDQIVDGIWLIAEETFWGVPAHLGMQKHGTGLPDVTEPVVDLFAAETAGLLAWVLYLLEPQLRQVSPLVPDRIRIEITRRILDPCLNRNFAWMGFDTKPPNNWDPWICSNWLTAALLVETREARRDAAVRKIIQCLDFFLNGYADDGGCDEGPSYWGRAGASLFECLELLYGASGGKLNAFNQPLIHAIGLYICRAHIAGDWYTNFGDASARLQPAGDLIYRYGRRVGDDVMMRHGAWCAFSRDEKAIPSGHGLGRALPALFNLAELRRAPRAQALLRDSWFAGIGTMMARARDGSVEGLYLAAQAGNNGVSHNHNDVGNFIVFANGEPVLIDAGVGTYTAKTFSDKRYEIWTMQSAYHNCPTIDGVMQQPGGRYASTDVSWRANDRVAELQMDIAHAYPAAAKLESWRRSFRLDRNAGNIEVRDNYVLRGPAREITLTLMTPCRVTLTPGTLQLENRAQITFDASLEPTVEEIKLDDQSLRNVWGDRLYRILLTARNPKLRAEWLLRIA
ncbi:MAG: heparinase II/III-family protein [Bryobacterales bacterium]|nr:heparinase II/III-family protein [Bryobacterales bacterium]